MATLVNFDDFFVQTIAEDLVIQKCLPTQFHDLICSIDNLQLTLDKTMNGLKKNCRDCHRARQFLLDLQDGFTGAKYELLETYNLGVCDPNELKILLRAILQFIEDYFDYHYGVELAKHTSNEIQQVEFNAINIFVLKISDLSTSIITYLERNNSLFI